MTVPTVRSFIGPSRSHHPQHQQPDFHNKDGPLSSSYIQGFARALGAFSSWLYEDGYTDTNVLKNLKPPRVQAKVVDVLSDEEVGRLLRVFNREDPFGARNYSIVITMLDSGRPSYVI